MTDTIAERARKIGGTTIRSISDIARNQRLKDNNKEGVSPQKMIGELCEDNQQLTKTLRATHEICDRHNDVATASLIEVWIDESEKRTWFLAEIGRDAKNDGQTIKPSTLHAPARYPLVKRVRDPSEVCVFHSLLGMLLLGQRPNGHLGLSESAL